MKNQKMQDLSDEQLLKNRKSVKIITYMLAGTLILLFAMTILTAIKKGFGALNVVPIALLPILLLNFKNLADMDKELKSRNIN